MAKSDSPSISARTLRAQKRRERVEAAPPSQPVQEHSQEVPAAANLEQCIAMSESNLTAASDVLSPVPGSASDSSEYYQAALTTNMETSPSHTFHTSVLYDSGLLLAGDGEVQAPDIVSEHAFAGLPSNSYAYGTSASGLAFGASVLPIIDPQYYYSDADLNASGSNGNNLEMPHEPLLWGDPGALNPWLPPFDDTSLPFDQTSDSVSYLQNSVMPVFGIDPCVAVNQSEAPVPAGTHDFVNIHDSSSTIPGLRLSFSAEPEPSFQPFLYTYSGVNTLELNTHENSSLVEMQITELNENNTQLASSEKPNFSLLYLVNFLNFL
ncbi:hypothetical protein B0H21DRAFT_767307 [Amylocystis lapponica]|nr:hypothetical protein B0H21DRAFT_767307 [Amylocystis lapponica]